MRDTRNERSRGPIICKNRYSTPRTLSDGGAHRAQGIIARSAHSPSSPAPPARRFAADGLDRSARPSKSGRHATMHCCDAVRTEGWDFIRHRPTGRVLVFSHNYRQARASHNQRRRRSSAARTKTQLGMTRWETRTRNPPRSHSCKLWPRASMASAVGSQRSPANPRACSGLFSPQPWSAVTPGRPSRPALDSNSCASRRNSSLAK
jgi:hypothetical protein